MLPIGFILKKSYKILRHIASGGFGNTYEAIVINNNTRIAVKEFFMKSINDYDVDFNVVVKNHEELNLFQEQKEKFLREAQILACLNNPHIVKVYDSFNENSTAYYVMEFIEGNTLDNLVKSRMTPFKEFNAKNIFLQILNALHEVHSKNILHLDIKPANIILNTSGLVKIIDFGASKLQTISNNTVATYTPAYAPIELQQQQLNNLGPWTDLYSAGATLFFLINANKPPFASEILNKGNSAFIYNTDVSSKTKDLIRWLMQPIIANRPSNVKQVFDYMENGIIDNTHFNNTNEISTIYPKQVENNSFNQKTIYKHNNNDKPKKNRNGCVWSLVIFVILVATSLFFLWKLRILKFNSSSLNNDGTAEVQIDEKQYLSELEQLLFGNLMTLCDQTQLIVNNCVNTSELEDLQESFYGKIDSIRNSSEYNGVELNENHYLQFENKKNQIEKLIVDKINSIQEELSKEMENQYEDSLSQMENYLQEDVNASFETNDSAESEEYLSGQSSQGEYDINAAETDY